MFPNPQDVLPITRHASIDEWVDALQAAAADGADAVRAWATPWIAGRLEGWADTAPGASVTAYADRLVTLVLAQRPHATLPRDRAQSIMAALFGFAAWPALQRHVAADEASSIARFERSADAIVRGDLDTLAVLLRDDPALIAARSDRAHGATLLHYVAANGVENFRQRTPASIVAVATALLDAGAEVNATCEVYGGGATTLGLTVTSAHPRAAGVQEPLARLLLARGADIPARVVRDALANGCPEAARFMADILRSRGESVPLDEAAGIGDTALVAAWLARVPSTDPRCGAALQMVAWYDRREVLALLLDHGVPVNTRAADGGETALHVASYLGNAELVSILLARGADPRARDARWQSMPLDWARHAHEVDGRGPADGYARTMALLEAASG